MKKTFIRKYDGWPGKTVEYSAEWNDGTSGTYTCSEDEWMVMVLKDKLVKDGADLDTLELFEEAVKDVARTDEMLSNAGEGL